MDIFRPDLCKEKWHIVAAVLSFLFRESHFWETSPVLLAIFLCGIVGTIAENILEDCDNESPLQILVLFDILAPQEQAASFRTQQMRITKTLRHLDVVASGRNRSYALIAFHRLPVVLTQLNNAAQPESLNADKLINQIEALRPRRKRRSDESSPAKALHAAGEHTSRHGIAGAKTIVFLIHDGHNSDLIAETLEATAKLVEIEAEIFVISGTEVPNVAALVGYAQERSKVYTRQDETVQFFEALNEKVGVCFEEENQGQRIRRKLAGTKAHNDISSEQVANEGQLDINKKDACISNKIDLLLLLDTSGSLFHSFSEEKQLLVNLLERIDSSAFEEQSLQIGAIKFASNATVVLPLSTATNQSKTEILETIRNIQFVGKTTKIADAVEAGLKEFKSVKDRKALQIVALISDGHGQEFWNAAQIAGRKLRDSGAHVYAATTSTDFNIAELALYTGDDRRIFVDGNQTNFAPTLSTIINHCIRVAPPTEDSISSILGKEDNNSTFAEVMASIDPFQRVVSPPESLPQSNASAIQALNQSENTTSETATQFDSPNAASSSEERDDKDVNGLSRIFRDDQNLSKVPDDCLTDVVFLIDKASGASQAFEYVKQMELLANLVNKMDAEDIATQKVQLAAVTFGGKNARTEVSFSQHMNKSDFVNILMGIQSVKTHSSFSKGIQQAIKEVAENRRSKARLIVIVAWSGINGRNNDDELNHAANELLSIPQSEVFAVTLNPENKFERLKALSGDIFHVYVDARVRQFVEQASFALSACTLPPSDESKRHSNGQPELHEPLTSVEKVERLESAARSLVKPNCNEDPVDLILIMDLSMHSPANIEEVDHRKQVAIDLLKQSPSMSYERRIRLALIKTGSSTTPLISLRNAIARDDAIFAIDRLEGISEGNSSLAQSLDIAKDEVKHFHREGARLAVVIFTADGKSVFDKLGHSIDPLLESGALGLVWLAAGKSEVVQPPLTLPELRLAGNRQGSWANEGLQSFDSRSKNAVERFLFSTRRQIFDCQAGPDAEKSRSTLPKLFSDTALALDDVIGSSSSDDSASLKLIKKKTSNENSTSDQLRQNESLEPNISDSLTNGSGESVSNNVTSEEKPLSTENPKASLQPKVETLPQVTLPQETSLASSSSTELPSTIHPTVSFDLDADHPKVSILNEECKVDLIFVIDTSQSVAEEFQKQLQFAVDLVKRLPDEDFSQRVQVATVSFYKSARVQFPFGQLKEKSAVLDALFAVEHTGGSTSAVSGVELAVDEIERARRKNARLMVVLISDGNSQDPWDKVLTAADRLRSVNADVYAVTVSHDYFFRELELYAGNKWFVYIDARIRQFLDEAETSLVECKSPSIPMSGSEKEAKSTTSESASTFATTESSVTGSTDGSSSTGGECDNDPVDLLFILDTSTSVEKEFYAEKNFALDLVKVLPDADFQSRITIALSKFNGTAELQFGFGKEKTKNDVLYSIERIEHTGGQTSLVSGTEVAVAEAQAHHRPNSRLVIVIISDGNSQDEWQKAQETAQSLRKLGGEVFAVTLSKKYYFDELKEYTGNETHIYTDERITQFIQDVGQSVVRCSGANRNVEQITMPPTAEVSVTPSTTPKAEEQTHATGAPENEKGSAEKNESRGFSISSGTDFARDDKPIIAAAQREDKGTDAPLKSKSSRCKYSKMDVIIILDASTSRENVFEHQRELALSLIERLPISKDDTHVATGINSFTSVPTLRQNLGLGRDRKMVRKAIEDIKYHGGSTLTAEAVELAVKDLEQGRRPDALQVVVLMNDGMSQDLWERVLASSEKLAATGAERFGVALGQDVDLRELKHYIGNENRIYRDGETERFLNDVVSLLGDGEKDCSQQPSIEENGFEFQVDNACEKPQLDVVVLLDNSDKTPNLTDPKLNANRYLLLDVLGSLPLETHVKLAVVSFAGTPKLEYKFTDPQDREHIFEKIESIGPVRGQPSYAPAVEAGLHYYNQNRRPDARGLFLVVGNGENAIDSTEQRSLASNALRRTKGLTCHAVDSRKEIDIQTLTAYTGSSSRVYNYDRNAEFAKVLLALATAGQDCEVQREQPAAAALSLDESYSTSKPLNEESSSNIQRDIAAKSVDDLDDKKAFGIESADEQKRVVASGANDKVITPRPTIPSSTTLSTASTGANIIESKIEEQAPKIPNNEERAQESINGRNSQILQEQTSTTAESRIGHFTSSSTTSLRVITGELPISESTITTRTPILSSRRTSTTLPRTSSSPPRSSSSLLPSFRLRTNEEILQRLEQARRNQLTSSTSPRSASSGISGSGQSTQATTVRPLRRRISTPQTPLTSTSATTAKFSASEILQRQSASAAVSEPFRPGCLIDLILLFDSSGSVQETFEKEKQMAADVISNLRIGTNNARVALIKFAAIEKVKTLYTFDKPQSNERILQALEDIPFSDGVTAIHGALLQAITEYTPLKGARPGVAEPLVIIFTDGFGQQDISKEAELLRRVIPRVYAVAVNHQYPISRPDLERITGETGRVFTDQNIAQLHTILKNQFRSC
ncbi:von willebrand factor type A domain-containing protein [Ditylenchus destructor]|nr:von willebrand factor type A domain-containing protein [Ditylenchus destructor]